MMPDITLEKQGRIWHRLAPLSMAMLLPSLGTSIVNVALPRLAASFEATMAEVQWLVICYLLAVTSLIVGAGRLGDLIGRRRLLLIGIALFAVASAAGAFAPNLWVLIGARSVQGVGAAVMMALTIAMAGDSVPKDRRGSAMGLMGTISAVGTALGPLVGGAMIAAFGWPAVFAVLAVMGVGALLMGSTLLPVDEKPVHEAAAHDGIGTVLLAVSLFAFTGLLTFGARLSASALLAGVALTALGFVAFGWHQTRTPSPLVRLELVRDRELRTGLISLALVSAIMMATLVVGPFYLSGVLGLGSFGTGLVMSVGPVVAALTGAPAGRLVDRAGSFRVMAGGLGAVTAGSVLLTVLPVPFGVGGYMTGLVVITFGYALFQAANTTAIMEGAPSDRRGVTSALLGLSRNIGLISGASAMGTVYAAGPRIAGGLGLGSSEEAGLQVTFITAIGLAGLALGLSLWRRRHQLQLLT
jgi:MFS family permease